MLLIMLNQELAITETQRFLAAWPWFSLLTHFDKSHVLTSPPAGI